MGEIYHNKSGKERHLFGYKYQQHELNSSGVVKSVALRANITFF